MIRCCCLLFWLARPAAALAQLAPNAGIRADRLAAAEDWLERYHDRLGLPGVTVSVATADSVLLAVGFGVGTVEGRPLTGRTPVGIGSVTKTFTAAAIVELAARDLLELDAPVERYLPDFRLQGRFVPRSITLRHLLQHRSGLRQWDGHDDRAQRHGTFDHLAPTGPPGAEGRYSSLNYIILGQVLRASTGRTYADNLGRLLFEPLELHNTFVAGDSASASVERARGHQSWFGVQVSRDEPTPPPFLVPAGFIGLSAHDLGRYSGMLLGSGTFAGQPILDSSAVAALLGPLDTSGVSLGWGRRRVDGELYLEHKGNARTTSARMRLLPERGYAITVLATTNSGPFFDATDQVMHNIQRIIEQGHAPAPWPGERLFKGIVLAGTVLSVGSMLHQANRWRRAGAPIGVDGSRQSLGRLTFDVAAGGFILFGVPRLIGVPISTLGEYFPDLGIALGVSAGAGIVGGVLRAFTATARPAS